MDHKEETEGRAHEKIKEAKSQAAIDNATIDNDKKSNELTHLIPCYTAPMSLEAKSLGNITDLDVTQLRKQAEASDKAKYNSKISIRKSCDNMPSKPKVKTVSSLSNPNNSLKIPTSFTSSFHNKPNKQNDDTAGSKWFNMASTPMSDALKADLSLIRNRNYLDPKKFYKSSDSFNKIVQLGTVIEGSGEFYTSRLTKKERRANFTSEIMADGAMASYAKRKFGEVQDEKERRTGGGRGRGKRSKSGGKKRR